MTFKKRKITAFGLRVRRFNRTVPIRAILEREGLAQSYEKSIWCPFHPDDATGHRSAVIKDEGNIVFCFSERRVYRPYDVVKLKGKKMEEYNDLVREDLEIKDPEVSYRVDPVDFKAVMAGKLTVYDLAEKMRKKMYE